MTARSSLAAYDAQAADWAAYQRSGQNLAHRYIEKPAMFALLPDLRGKSVLCIGCGSGEEVAELVKRGAKRVVGIDLSKGMIREAQKAYPDLDFRVMDMAQLGFKAREFDVVYSSLTIHYAPDWAPVLKEWKRVLKKDGEMLFSTQHPAFFGGERRYGLFGGAVRLLGYKENKLTRRDRIFGDYFKTGQVKLTHRAGGRSVTLINYNRPVSAMLNQIRAAGLTITDCVEPRPDAAAKKAQPRWAKLHERIPMFIIFRLR